MVWVRGSLIIVLSSAVILCLIVLFSHMAFNKVTSIPIERTYTGSVRELPREKEYPETLGIKHWWQAAALILWYYKTPIDYKCKKVLKAGNWFVCQDQLKAPCLVYSFGIADDFTFDDAIGKLGCEVHSFDPSTNMTDHKRSPQVTFHTIGISGIDSDTFVARRDEFITKKQIWKIRTLRSIMKELGHQHRVLDVLKIDIEGHEWAVAQNIMDDDMIPRIKQFCVEWHFFPYWPAKSDYIGLYQMYTKLKQTGLSEFKKDQEIKPNFNPQEFNIQWNIHFINRKFYG